MYLIKTETLTGIADAIREKTGTTGSIAVTDMATAISDIEAGSGEGHVVEDQLISSALSGAYVNNRVTYLGSGAFMAQTKLTSVSLPSVVSGNPSSAFERCTKLVSVSIPNFKTLLSWGSLFQGCSALTTLEFPAPSGRISSYLFDDCKALTDISFMADVTETGQGIFRGCVSLTNVALPKLTKIAGYSFQNCTGLTDISFEGAASVDSYAFAGCTELWEANLPNVKSVGTYAFQGCHQLFELDLPVCTSIQVNAFLNAASLTRLLLRSGTRCNMNNANALSGTPIANGSGHIYVPSSLIAAYKTAVPWSTYAAQFRALEDYTLDGTTTGALDPAKVAA